MNLFFFFFFFFLGGGGVGGSLQLRNHCSQGGGDYIWNFILDSDPSKKNTVNSLVSDHPWCTTKWSLTGGGRLRERSIK